MTKFTAGSLSRRERQIMDILYRRGRATAGEVMEELSGDPNYSTVRTQLRVLEEKGHVRHEEQGLRYVYIAGRAAHAARKSALRHLVETFFDGSAEEAVAALLGGEGARLSDEELERIAELVKKAGSTGQAAGGQAGRRAGERRRSEMTLLLNTTIKISLIVLVALATTACCGDDPRPCATWCSRRPSRARRRRRLCGSSRPRGRRASALARRDRACS